MKIRELIKKLEKELNRGNEEIFIQSKSREFTVYDFDLGIDIDGHVETVLFIPNNYPVTD